MGAFGALWGARGSLGEWLWRARPYVVAARAHAQRAFLVLLQGVGDPSRRSGDGENRLSRGGGHAGGDREHGQRQVDIGVQGGVPGGGGHDVLGRRRGGVNVRTIGQVAFDRVDERVAANSGVPPRP